MAGIQEFDLVRFVKVLALVNGGATEGERSAARARAEHIAQRADLTFDQALDRALSGNAAADKAKPANATPKASRPAAPSRPTRTERDALMKKLRHVIVFGSLEALQWSPFGVLVPALMMYGLTTDKAAPFGPFLSFSGTAFFIYCRFLKMRLKHIREAWVIRKFLKNYPMSA